ncbi:MAG: cupin domain-containing protein [Rhodospirillaceae bacterium]|jgi:ethanolamine utilization protein EutQ|nr:cupin domain-containing protein [Rhodospirillaceae bacterium]
MAKSTLLKATDRKFGHLAGPPGEIAIARDVDRPLSKTMGCSVLTMKQASLPWTLRYDEYFYCLDGELSLHVGDKTYVMEPGDGIWIPDNTKLVYEAQDSAKVIVALYPVDWQDNANDAPGEELPLKLVKPGERVLQGLGDEAAGLTLTRDAGPDVSATMTCGVCAFENARLPWTMRYDEYLYCLDGHMRIREGDEVHEMGPDDAIWLPDGVEVVYEADAKATLAFAIYPIDWGK